MADNLRSYLVGSTVVLYARINTQPTRVFLGALATDSGTPVTRPDSYDFVNVEGTLEYILNIPTDTLAPGVYRYQVVALGPSSVVAKVEDYFVLAAALTTLS